MKVVYKSQCALNTVNCAIVDIDECLESNETCPDNSICINTNGSFDCICGPGFQFQNGTCQGILLPLRTLFYVL